jgi:PAS domain S-box-containing protein
LLRWHIANHYKEEMASWRVRQTSLADDQAQRVADWLKERQGDAQVLSASPAVRTVLRAYNAGRHLPQPTSATTAEALAVLDNMAKSYSYVGVYVLDHDAQVVMGSSRSKPVNPLFSELCRAMIRSGVPRMDLVGDAPSRSFMGFGAPVFAETGTPGSGQPTKQILGMVLLVTDASQTLFPLVTREVVPTRTGETVLVRREGNEVVFFSPLRHIPVGSPSPRFPISAASIPAQYALEARQTFVDCNDYRGTPVLAATQYIPATGWGMVRKIDRAEALEDFHRQVMLESLAACLLILLLGGILYFLRRYIVTRVQKREEEKFRVLLESAPDAIYIVEPSTLRILGRNRRAAEMDGYSDEDIAHMTVMDLHPPEDGTLLRERLERGLESGAKLPIQTLHLLKMNGQLVPVEESQTLVDAGGERLVLNLVHDIAERIRAEQELRQVNRALRTISECNQVLVRAVEESDLSNQICETLVRVGGYRMAWVGFVEHDEGKSVRPVAQAGFEDGYLQTANITWGETERGRGPTGTAIRTGKPVVVRFIQEDPNLAPWRKDALKRGYVSSAALPIQVDGQALGVLTIYSQEPDVFDSKEVTLLMELADDLAYGIQALRTRGEHQRAEAALRGSERKYRQLHESMMDGFVRVTMDGRITETNAAFCKMLGYTPEELLNFTSNDLTPEKWHVVERGVIEGEVLTRGYSEVYFKEYQQKGGAIIPVEVRKYLLLDESGNPCGMWGSVRDITERKWKEEMLREYEKVVEGTDEMITVVDREYRHLLANRAFLDKVGLEREEVVGSSVSEVMGEELFGRLIKEKLDECFHGQVVRYEGKRQYPKFGERDVLVSYFPIMGDHGVDRVACVLRDISERKRAEESLKEERHLLRTLMDSLPDVIYFKDRESHFTRINKAHTKEFGLSDPAQAVGKTDFDFFTAEHAQEAYNDEQEIIRTGQPLVGKEEKETWPNGDVTWASTTKMPLRDVSGNIIGTFGVSRNITERKRAEDLLRESEERFRTTFENAGIGMALVDMQGHPFKSNPALRQMLGYGEEELCRMPFTEFTHPDDRELDWRLYSELTAGKREMYELEKRFLKKGSGVLWGLLTVSLVKDRQWSPLYAVGMVQDITERKRAEAALLESEERLRSLVENATVGIYRTTPHGQILMANSALVRMLGYANFEALAARNLEEEGFEPGYPRGEFRERMEQDGEVMGLEEAWKKQDGSVIFVRESARAVRSQDGKTLYYDGVVEDVTGEKRAEEEHIRLVTAIEQSAEAVVITNPAGNIEYVNPAFTQITGYSREEALGQNPRILKSGKHDPEFYQQLWATILNGESWRGEVINRKKDGSLYTEEMNITPVRSARGELTHFIATKQDVTERRILEAQLHQAAKMQAVGQLAGGVAHDFNNLLTVINGYAEILMENPVLDTKSSGYLKEIYNAGERAGSLTRQLLAFSRRQVLTPQVLDLNAVVSNLEKMLRRLIGEDIRLHTLLSPSLGRVKADPGQVEQIIMNLVVNARDAMPVGGQLTLETCNVDLDEDYTLSHPTVKPGPHVMLGVSDTGVGMTPETKARIFEPFFTTKEMGKGTGLGLATVYGIVKQSGGSIWVYSELGQGTVFKIYFPIVSESPAPRGTAKAETDSASGTETILVVEDEESVRSLVRLALVSGGYQVLETQDLESALATCAKHDGPIHLLLTDVVMRQMSGPVVAEKVAALRPGIRVLYMSGYMGDAVVHHGVLSHEMPFIQKPFSPMTLRKKIREVLGGK